MEGSTRFILAACTVAAVVVTSVAWAGGGAGSGTARQSLSPALEGTVLQVRGTTEGVVLALQRPRASTAKLSMSLAYDTVPSGTVVRVVASTRACSRADTSTTRVFSHSVRAPEGDHLFATKTVATTGSVRTVKSIRVRVVVPGRAAICRSAQLIGGAAGTGA